MLRIAIVEDNALAAELLKEYIDTEFIEVIAIYSSGEEALESVDAHNCPEVMLVDIGLPGISGIEVTRLIKERFPSVEIIIQTVFEDSETIVSAIKAGASAYILKASSREDTVKAVQSVVEGESFISGRVARKILLEFSREDISSETYVDGNVVSSFALTSREEEILNLLIGGASYKQIAADLFISLHTVNNHIRKIYEKMQVHSRGEAAARVLGPHQDNGSDAVR